jgi:crossover junction endodeoxyribonuclease RuvC
MIVLGIDPGLATIGYGVIKKGKKINGKPSLKCLDCGLIETSPLFNQPKRLQKINNHLSKLIKKYRPDFLAMENVYFFKNLKTALPVSRAEGVILLTAAKNKLPVFTFTPLQIKLTITGFGHSDKKILQQKIKRMLKLKKLPKTPDAYDALGVALTFILKDLVREV